MKIIKKTALTLLILVLFISHTTSSYAGGCGTWETYRVSPSFCAKEHCGIWDKTALVQLFYKKRKCVKKDNTSTWEYKIERVHIDCGC